jgi:choline dehydrogenase-like flavoprotein
MTLSADVVIVGSGVAGSLVAARLAASGVKVLILEAGPRVQRAAALAQYRAAVIKLPESPYPDTPFAPRPRSDQPDVYFLQNGPDKFGSAYLRQVGGTTWHWLGTTLRFVPDDFRLRSRFGVGVDWPLSYDDLEPWYCEAERELGVAGDDAADLGVRRSQPSRSPERRTKCSPLRRLATRYGTRTARPAAAAAAASRFARFRPSTTRPFT